MATVLDAIVALGCTDFMLSGEPTTETEFNDSFEGINGQDVSAITWSAVSAKKAELEAEYTNTQYQRDRASAYPSIADQLDQIYHEGIDAWKETIAAVKAEYPKSGEVS